MERTTSRAKIRELLDLRTWHVTPSDLRSNFGGLDGLRGIAILLVIANHSMPYIFNAVGQLGVQLFFVLSGFLITRPFFKRLKEEDWYQPGYILRRAAKVLPPYYLSIIWFTALLMITTHSLHPLLGAIETMAFLHIFIAPTPHILFIYWSLAAEVAFYATIPILFYLARRPLQRWPWLLGLVFILGSTALLVLTWNDFVLRATSPLVNDVLLNFQFFGWGMLFACLKLALSRCTSELVGLLVSLGVFGFFGCCGVATTLNLLDPQSPIGLVTNLSFAVTIGACAFLMLFVVYDSRSLICRMLTNPLLSLAGMVSFEWYLFHLIFLNFADSLLPSHAHGTVLRLVVRAFFGFPVAFVFSALLYRLFSLPILRLSHQRKKAASAV